MNKRTALVFGATGLVGSFIISELLKLEIYNKVLIFSRRMFDLNHEKAEFVIDDLSAPENLKDRIKGDDVYCCLGTTIKKAGSQEAFKKVDLELPVKIAETALMNNVENFAVISSIGADAKSRNFYLRTKGEMEQAVLKLKFEHLIIVRPSLLTGPRKQFRFGEIMAKVFMTVFNPVLLGKLRKYRSIKAQTVARAMIGLTLIPRNKPVFESDELETAAQNFVVKQ